MRLGMTAAAALVLAAAAQPSHAAGTDWVDVAVDSITSSGNGDCEVSGWVVTVRDGANFEPGSPIDFSMDCDRTGADPAAFSGELSGSDLAAAGASVKVSVKLDGSGRVIDYVGMEADRTDGVSRGAYISNSYYRPLEPGDRAPEATPSGSDDDEDMVMDSTMDHDADSVPLDDRDAPEPPDDDEPQ